MTGDRLVKLLTRIGLAALVAVLGVVGYGGWRLHKGMQWVRQQNARADELPTLEDLLGPPVPDEENAAVVYRQAFDAFDLTDEDKGVLLGEPDREHPDQRVYDYRKLVEVLEKNKQALELIERGAATDKCRFPLRQDEFGVPTDTAWRHLRGMRRAGQLFTAQAALASARGDAEGACQSLIVALRLSQHVLALNGSPWAWSTGHSAAEQATKTVARAVRESDPSAQQMTALRRLLAELDVEDSLKRSIEAHRALDLRIMETAKGEPNYLLTKAAFGDDDPELQRTVRELGHSPIWRPVLAANRADYISATDEVLSLLSLPYRDSHEQLRQTEGRWGKQPAFFYVSYLFKWYYFPTLKVRRRDEVRTRIDLCIVALDLKAYKRERGEYPETLDELPEASEESYAEDVFTGKPFKYRREGEGFLLYSFGRDLDDDGGLPLGREVDGKPEWEDGDLVWRCGK